VLVSRESIRRKKNKKGPIDIHHVQEGLLEAMCSNTLPPWRVNPICTSNKASHPCKQHKLPLKFVDSSTITMVPSYLNELNFGQLQHAAAHTSGARQCIEELITASASVSCCPIKYGSSNVITIQNKILLTCWHYEQDEVLCDDSPLMSNHFSSNSSRSVAMDVPSKTPCAAFSFAQLLHFRCGLGTHCWFQIFFGFVHSMSTMYLSHWVLPHGWNKSDLTSSFFKFSSLTLRSKGHGTAQSKEYYPDMSRLCASKVCTGLHREVASANNHAAPLHQLHSTVVNPNLVIIQTGGVVFASTNA
jgi:hypothetical protein